MDEKGIADIQRAQRAMLKTIATLKPDGALGRAVKYAAVAAHRYAVVITHVWRYKGGALRAAHKITMAGTKATISISADAINPRGQRPSEYGFYEHRRGGSHAFYARTEAEYGQRAAVIGARAYMSELP